MKKYKLGFVEFHRIGRWEYTLNLDGSVCIRAYHGNCDRLEIPETLMGRPVTALGGGFYGAKNMQLLIIPTTVTSIGERVCDLAEDLQGVWIPAEVTSIHETAFSELEHLIIFTPEDSVAHHFAAEHGIPCEPDTHPEMEDDDTWQSWGDYRYTVNSDGEALLREYNGTDMGLIVPAELDGYPLVYVLDNAFRGNDFLQEVYLPASVREVGHWAFADCPSLRVVGMPDGLEFLGGGAFAACSDLENVDLPPMLDMLHPCTFSGCSSLREVTLPEQLRVILPMAFSGCTSLERVHLNHGLQSLVGTPFWACPKLRRPELLPDTLDDKAREMLESLPA